MRVRTILVTVFATMFAAELYAADKVRIGVSNYNISNLTVGVAQTRGLFKQEGIDAELIRMNPNVATMALVSRAEIKSVREVKGRPSASAPTARRRTSSRAWWSNITASIPKPRLSSWRWVPTQRV